MVVTFKSRAGADVIMLGDSARQLLKLLGKDPDEKKGILTVEQLPSAIESLQRAIDTDRERARQKEQADAQKDDDDEADVPKGMAAAVNFHQRGWPLLELMMQAQRDGVPVTWGT